MTQLSIETLVDYWQARRVGDAAPTRAAIDPMDFPELLPQVFMLGRSPAGDYVFRLAGGFITDLHGRDLRGADVTSLWAQVARSPLRTALEDARRDIQPIHVSADVQAGVQTLPIDLVFLPLANAEGVVDRFMGLYQPTAPVARLRGQRADRLALVSLNWRSADEVEQPRIRLVAIAGERVR